MADPKEQRRGSEPAPPAQDEAAAPRKPGPARRPVQGYGNAPGVEDVDAWHHGTPPEKKRR